MEDAFLVSWFMNLVTQNNNVAGDVGKDNLKFGWDYV